MKMNITISIDSEILEKIDLKAKENDRSRSNMIEIMLKKEFKNTPEK